MLDTLMVILETLFTANILISAKHPVFLNNCVAYGTKHSYNQ